MSDDNLRLSQQRAIRYREWCEGGDGLYAVFDAVEKHYLGTLITSDIADHPLREKVYHRVNALRDIRRVMETAIIEGASATATINNLNKIADKRRVKA